MDPLVNIDEFSYSELHTIANLRSTPQPPRLSSHRVTEHVY